MVRAASFGKNHAVINRNVCPTGDGIASVSRSEDRKDLRPWSESLEKSEEMPSLVLLKRDLDPAILGLGVGAGS